MAHIFNELLTNDNIVMLNKSQPCHLIRKYIFLPNSLNVKHSMNLKAHNFRAKENWSPHMRKAELTVVKKVRLWTKIQQNPIKDATNERENFPREFHHSFSHSYIHKTKLLLKLSYWWDNLGFKNLVKIYLMRLNDLFGSKMYLTAK